MKDRQETIERYLMNRMDEGERSDFEKSVGEDPDLAEALALQRDLMIGIQSHFDQALKEKLQTSSKSESNGQAKVVKMQSKVIWRWASAAALALVVGVFYFMNQGDKTDRLYSQYFESFPNIVEFQQRDEQTNLSEAFFFYQNGDWEDAAAAFDALQSQSDEIYPVFYDAICQMNLTDYQQAEEGFMEVISSGDSRFAAPATWYLALTHLAREELTRCREILIEISSSPGNYRDDALNLLEEIE
ncbi:MAG: hypothetical protein OEM26_11030 [Saprospiraceae bacterium]|nr:hypothetical protein [Saprospiraceae bacterium]